MDAVYELYIILRHLDHIYSMYVHVYLFYDMHIYIYIVLERLKMIYKDAYVVINFNNNFLE